MEPMAVVDYPHESPDGFKISLSPSTDKAMDAPHDPDLEITLFHAGAGEYAAELRFTSPTSETEIPPLRAVTGLDPGALLEHHHDPAAYGAALTDALFAADELSQLFAQVRATVDAGGLDLRLRLRLDPGARELHALRWELLRAPGATSGEVPGALLATSERILFSRFMASTDWRTVKIGRKADLRALVAVAAPNDLDRFGLADVDLDGEVRRARDSLAGIDVTVAGEDEPLTPERLLERLREDFDLVYLVCHGALSRRGREAILFLQDEDGKVAVCRGHELGERFGELVRPPRLVVLASCESAGSERGESAVTAHAALAPLLADAGVAAVVAMQGRISMATVEKAMPIFFRELLRDGRIDRALAVARGTVRTRYDSWMPALFMRLKRGRIWYEPGFSDADGDFSKWQSITGSVRCGHFVPILGVDVGEHVFGSAGAIAHRLSDRFRVALSGDHRADLPRVAQFMSVRESRELARDATLKSLRQGAAKNFPAIADAGRLPLPKLLDAVVESRPPGDPYEILARLPATVYVNACWDPLLIKSLKAAGREPRPLLCDWRTTADSHPRAPACDQEPTVERPVVHQVFGVLGKPDSLVLTEDDFFDYMIAAARYELIPGVVSGALTRGSLLFLGFRLDSWTFRVLFRLIMAMEGRDRLRDLAHVGVQVNPEDSGIEDPDSARLYLEQYFTAGSGAPPISVYWGSVRDFLEELQRRLAETDDAGEPPAEVAEDEDDWLR